MKARIYTSTTLSDDAKKFARVLGIEYKENIPLAKYPCIKCNSSKIYHLPFDQQYDRTKIQDAKTEKYVATISEAENMVIEERIDGEDSRKSYSSEIGITKDILILSRTTR